MQENINKPQGTDFMVFVSGLMAEGLMSLGLMEHPVTKKMEKDLKHASMVIDILVMLGEKTNGNLTKVESDSLAEIISQLR